MKKILLFILLVWANSVDAQNKFSISGYVKDSLSSESLIGATVSFSVSVLLKWLAGKYGRRQTTTTKNNKKKNNGKI